jgi:hypothetical protein
MQSPQQPPVTIGIILDFLKQFPIVSLNPIVMATFIQREDYDFLLLSEKFCSGIHKYATVLGLDPLDVETFKDDCAVLAFFFDNSQQYSCCGESFTRYKVSNMRIDFSRLAQICRNSRNYTVSIVAELGIELPVYAFQAN